MDRLTEQRNQPPAPLIILVVRRRPTCPRTNRFGMGAWGGRIPPVWLHPEREPLNWKEGS